MSTNTKMKKGLIMTEISAKEFGKLQSDVEYLKNTSDSHTTLLEKMDGKLDKLVTHEQLDRRLEPIEACQKDHAARIAALEQRNVVSDASVWKKIGLSFEKNFVKFIGASLFIFALSVAFVYIQKEISAHREASETTTIIEAQQ